MPSSDSAAIKRSAGEKGLVERDTRANSAAPRQCGVLSPENFHVNAASRIMSMVDHSTPFLGASTALSALQSNCKDENHTSVIWQAAIDRYYAELRRGGVRGPVIDHDLWSIHSPGDLLKQIDSLAPPNSRTAGSWTRSLRRLEVLLSINDFVAVFTLSLGVRGQVAAAIWGSIRLFMKVGGASTRRYIKMYLAELFSFPNPSFQNSSTCSRNWAVLCPGSANTSRDYQ